MLQLIVLSSILTVPTRAGSAANNDIISLAACCQHGEFYHGGTHSCYKDVTFSDKFTWKVPIYSAIDDRLTNGRASVDQQQSFHCPNDSLRRSSTEFRLFDNGSLQTASTTLEPNQFCLGHIRTDTSVSVAVAYCVPHPCQDAICVRKCCPSGMAINSADKQCHSSAVPFVAPLYNVSSGSANFSTPYAVLDDHIPNCSDGFVQIGSTTDANDVFYITANSQLYIPAGDCGEDWLTADYCIDVFYDDTGSRMQGLACADESTETQLALAIFPYVLIPSSVFLLATFAVYAIVPELRNAYGVSVMCHVASMAVMYIGLAVIQMSSALSDGLCKGLAVAVHTAFLSTFSWLNVMSFDTWWAFRVLRPKRSTLTRKVLGRRFKFYSIYAWGVPLVIVIVGQILDHVVDGLPCGVVTPQFGSVKCWFSSHDSFLAYLYGPVAVLLFSNVVFFLVTVLLLQRASRDASLAVGTSRAKQKFRVIFSLFVLHGISWMLEFVSFMLEESSQASDWFFTDVINILTAVITFFIFVCKPKVWRLLKLNCPLLAALCDRRHLTSTAEANATNQDTVSRNTPVESFRLMGAPDSPVLVDFTQNRSEFD